MTDWYNEIDPYAAQWLRNLIAAGLIPPGVVDERDIRDVRAGDLDGYVQCHFFAGLGGWPYSLRLAGWPADRPVWTGSCPCQPFSVAGKQEGFDDPRHLWPEFSRLIEKRRPPVIFGEQVAGASQWLGRVRRDLESMDYAVGAIPIEAASAGAHHFRDRYWFVADRQVVGRQNRDAGSLEGTEIGERTAVESERRGGGNTPLGLADHDIERAGEGLQRGGQLGGAGRDSENRSRPLAHMPGAGRGEGKYSTGDRTGAASGVVDGAGFQHRSLVDAASVGWGEGWTEHDLRSRGFAAAVANIDGSQFFECPDGKWRRLPPPGVRWLGTRVPARVAKLRAIGNAIDPRPAAEFIGAYLDTITPPDRPGRL